MPLGTGTRLGPYEIQTAIGAGGMGEVYKATDTRLGRTVAIKVLPPHVANDPDLRRRFEREARTISSLNHPHICALYDVGHQDGVDFLVMEYVDGETLAQRLARGALPLEQALRYAIEIADALDKAHRQEIVHRDLKPGNIMLARSGTKLLDFGLAKTAAPTDAVVATSNGATVSTPLTTRGTILGTLQYMAPEQVAGGDVDARSGVFAFGAVLYEMVTGRRPFDGKSVASIIAAILEREPPAMATLQPLTLPALDHVLRRCLAKEPDERWQTAADLMRELKWVADSGAESKAQTPASGSLSRRERLVWGSGLALVSVVALVLAGLLSRPAAVAPETRVEIATPPTTDPASLAIAPDGRRIVYAATTGGQSRLWLRTLDSADPRELPGTDRGRLPFWSPDSKSIGFFADGRFKRLDIETGVTKDLVNAILTLGGTWNADDVLLFSMAATQPIVRLPATGGTPVPVMPVERGIGHRTPHFLPDGRHFLYQVMNDPNTHGIHVGALDGSASQRLLDVDSPAAYAVGHLFYVLQNTLMARPFDPVRLTFTGEPLRVAERIVETGSVAAFSVSAGGSILYRRGTSSRELAMIGTRQLAWIDRAGKPLSTLGAAGVPAAPELSPDDRRVVVNRATEGTLSDVWVLDTATDRSIRFTRNPQIDAFPVWSPDGQHIAFQSYQTGLPDIYRKRADNTGPEELILSTSDVKHPMDRSRSSSTPARASPNIPLAKGWSRHSWPSFLRSRRRAWPSTPATAFRRGRATSSRIREIRQGPDGYLPADGRGRLGAVVDRTSFLNYGVGMATDVVFSLNYASYI